MASQQQSSSSSTSQYPVDIGALVNQANAGMGNFDSVYKNINSFLNKPLSNDLFQGTIGPLLESLMPSEQASRTAMADQFRMAGGGQGGALQSGAFSNAVKQNEQNILGNRSQVVAKQASDVYKNILSGLGLQLNAASTPTQLTTNLIGAIRPLTQSQSSSSGSSQDPQGGGGSSSFSGVGGGFGGSGGFLGAPDLGYTPGIGIPNPYGGGSASVGPNYDPNEVTNYGSSAVNFAGFGGAGGGYGGNSRAMIDPSGAFTNNPIDQYGYQPSDWANDPYYQ